MTPLTLRMATQDDAGWIAARHGMLYADEAGFDESFAPLVTEILAQFFRHYDPAREQGWIAHQDGVPMGSIFCVAGPEQSAKLRLFFLERAVRGTGFAQIMLETCASFARGAGYPRMQLWTHESHRAAGRLYARNGFALIDSRPVRSFGQDLIEQTWSRDL